MIEIIPAIDIISGKCVRLTKGDYASVKSYSDDPADIALRFKDAGLRRLHIVDLDGARASFPRNLDVLEKIVSATGMEVEWGGGIKDRAGLSSVLESGAAQAICGSIAVTDPEEFRSWIYEYGSGRIILGADVRDGKVATHGWIRDSGLTVEDLVGMFLEDGLKKVICTDISRDGTLQGPSFDLYGSLRRQFPGIEFTASGGISTMTDIYELDRQGTGSVIVGKAIYEGRITVGEITEFNRRQNIL